MSADKDRSSAKDGNKREVILNRVPEIKKHLEEKFLNIIYDTVVNPKAETLIGSSGNRAERADLESLNQSFAEEMFKARKKTIESKYVLKPEENFKGSSYGQLLARWNNWVMSSHPYYYGGDILFLRGNMGSYTDPSTFLDMTDLSANGHTIPFGTAIFIPIITCQWNIGDIYEGTKIEDEETMRFAVRDYLVGGGPMWATMYKPEVDEFRIFDYPLTKYYAESPRFQLNVPSKSILRTATDDPLEPGDYDAVIGGYCVLLKDLPEGRYRIRFGGKGRRVYYTDSVYDINIVGTETSIEKSRTVKDISITRHSNEPILMKYFSGDEE